MESDKTLEINRTIKSMDCFLWLAGTGATFAKYDCYPNELKVTPQSNDDADPNYLFVSQSPLVTDLFYGLRFVFPVRNLKLWITSKDDEIVLDEVISVKYHNEKAVLSIEFNPPIYLHRKYLRLSYEFKSEDDAIARFEPESIIPPSRKNKTEGKASEFNIFTPLLTVGTFSPDQPKEAKSFPLITDAKITYFDKTVETIKLIHAEIETDVSKIVKIERF